MEKHWISESWDGFRPADGTVHPSMCATSFRIIILPMREMKLFLQAPQRPPELWEQVMDLSKKEREAGGVLDMDTKIISSITSHGPGYLNKDLEQIVAPDRQTFQAFPAAFRRNPYGTKCMPREWIRSRS